MDMSNYNWTNIVFDLREIFIQSGYTEYFPIKYVYQGTNCITSAEVFDLKKPKTPPEGFTFERYIMINRKEAAKIKMGMEEFEDSYRGATLILNTNHRIRQIYSIKSAITSWMNKYNKNKIEWIRKFDKLKEDLYEQDIDLYILISTLHEMSHCFSNINTKIDINIFKGLNSHERTIVYHNDKREKIADIIAIDVLVYNLDKIISIIKNNKED